ncbi:hypothetical protein LTR56_001886 [Elasticomyces elasticus]|nr:hypothetical protein LTR56_001886 [Elasticomyces elasticus]KAK3668763.1 hypothetical protein LTR22_000243 [Elasticomyces elasticus]KAK4930603.1 hypothetical protein LTR49_003017 [Elasticomyces elasticus]KAK5757922.1 hypothetical protein LTS12_011961 [Elasticomyces elasticus]
MTKDCSKRKREAPQDAPEEDEQKPTSQVKRFRSSFADTMTILVGKDKAPFIVHTKTLRAKSDFLNAAFQREWLEGQTKVVNLPEVKPKIFELYVTWSCFERIDLEILRLVETGNANPLGRGDETDDETEEQRKVWADGTRSLVRLYVAADFLGDAGLKRQTIDCLANILEAINQLHGLGRLLIFVWQSTPPGSGLRKFMLDYIASVRTLMHDWLAKLVGVLPTDFYVDLALHQLWRARSSDDLRHNPLPERKHMYYDGYESDASAA